jgi:hypothetical protein
MVWQLQMVSEVSRRLPSGATLDVVGSAADRSLIDDWSDLDLHLHLPHAVDLGDLLGGPAVWAAEEAVAAEGQVVRVVLADGRRVDFLAEAGRLLLPALAPDNDVRFLAALAVNKLGRRDQLIGLHLVLELLQACLVQAMLLRDRDEGTHIHRAGTERDQLAIDIAQLMQLPLEVAARPNVVERIVDLYGQWRSQLESGYVPDWSGLSALLTRGLASPEESQQEPIVKDDDDRYTR